MEYQSLIQLMTSTTLIKKATPLLVSVSVFSFILSNSSWHSFLFPLFKFYFSSIPMQVLSHALDKSWIFLICNGILVVIANTSGMVHSPSGFDLNDTLQKKIGDDLQLAPLDPKYTSLELSEPENAVAEVEGEEEEEEEKENDVTEEEGGGEDECLAEEQEDNSCLVLDVDDKQEQESGFFKTEAEGGEGEAETQELQIACIMGDEENEEESETSCLIEEEDQEQLYDDDDAEEEEGIDKLTTEELNKKFDDFIRKMKEELRIEAQQQLVVLVK